MIKPWEVCVLVYDYLQKNGYKKTLLCFNEECSSLNLPDPPPPIFSCVLEKLVSPGDLEHRLQSFDEVKKTNTDKELNGLKRMMELDDEMLQYMRRKFKKRKRQSSDHSKGKKSKKCSSQKDGSKLFSSSDKQQNSCIDDRDTLPDISDQSKLLTYESVDCNRDSFEHPDLDKTSNCEEKLKTPEKRLSSSRRKAATPKKLVTNQDSFVKILADNINAKNEEAALDTLNSVEPWLEQFINSLSEDPDDSELKDAEHPGGDKSSGLITSNNEEAAMSLLALNQSVQPISASDSAHSAVDYNTFREAQPQSTSISLEQAQDQPQLTKSPLSAFTVTQATSGNTTNHLSDAFNSAEPSTSNSCNIMASTVSTSISGPNSDNVSFDPIVIRNKMSMSLAQNNPNIEIIELPPLHSQYQHILPKPRPAPDQVPSSFHVAGDTVAPVYNFFKPSPQQQAQKFFGQLQRPYHQQLSRIDQLYLVDTSNRESPSTENPKTAGVNQNVSQSGALNANSKIDVSTQIKQPDITGSMKSAETKPTSSKESFVSWDQKIRKSIAETHFKTPSPKMKLTPVKSKPKSEVKVLNKGKATDNRKTDCYSSLKSTENSTADPAKKKHKKKKRRSKKEGGEGPRKSKKKIKKKREKEKDSLKKPPITPEFVNESLSSDEEGSVTKTPRVRHLSESDTMMAEDLLKSFNSSSNNTGSFKNTSTPITSKSIGPSVPSRKLESIRPAFLEENANSSFDIDESSRPKPVVIPEHSQNSCSCHSNHYKDHHKSKSGSTKTFSFQDDDHVNSPRNYTDTNSITVASLFPQISNSSISSSPKPKILDSTIYRNQKPEEESDQEQEEGVSDEDEVREQTSKLPPLSSSQRDLLDTSDEEQNSSLRSEEPHMISSQGLSKSAALSESDVDSPLKKSPLQSPKLRLLSVTRNDADLPLTEKVDPVQTMGKEGDEHEEEQLATELSENEELPAFDIRDDINDSQELIIDGTDDPQTEGSDGRAISSSKTRPRRSILAKERRRIKHAGKPSSTENDKNSENADVASVVEDSCDVWYQNVPNRMKAKAKSTFVCEICRKSFPSMAVLTVHSETCSKMYLVCSNCGRKCSSKSGLTLHKKSCMNMLNSSKSKEKRRTSGENSKIKISPAASKSGSQRKSIKKKKPKSQYIAKDIDEFLGNLRYQ